MNENVELIVNELSMQIANLSKERAIYAALATQYKHELEQVKAELEELKKEQNNKKGEEK
ncbi:hypothetical protein ABEV41_00095 [Geobacillus thermodenitrificans]|jgi:hypothetical protein|uniref:hypothetical protein n=1 Tax=Geobacillus thermodenitrificans TaxID=33940 RepID=UPI003D1FBC7D